MKEPIIAEKVLADADRTPAELALLKKMSTAIKDVINATLTELKHAPEGPCPLCQVQDMLTKGIPLRIQVETLTPAEDKSREYAHSLSA